MRRLLYPPREAVFKVSDSGKTYDVCHETKASLRDMAAGGSANVQVKGRVVECDETHGEELVIESVKKI